jgi:hypothetical protein
MSTHDMREALACPFCGSGNVSDGEILSSDADGGNRATQSECMNCGAVGPKGALAQDEIDYGSVKAIAAWNRRADTQKAPQPRTAPEPEGLPPEQEPKYTTNGHAIVNRASGEDIPADEPVFIFRARDKNAVKVLQFYAQRCQHADYHHVAAINKRIKHFRQFASRHPERMKLPDTAAGGLLCGTCIAAEIERLTLGFAAYRIAEAQAAPPAAQPAGLTDVDSDYRRMFGAAVASLAEISEALGIDEEKAACANGNELILEAISILAAKAQKAPPPRTAEPALTMKRHEWDSLSPEAKKLIHDRTREHTLQSARAAQAIRDTPLAEPAPAPAGFDLDAAVNRFLGWPLPKTFMPDCGISFDGRKDDELNKNKTWPIGTNLFTAIEAKAMLEHALGGVASVADGFARECDDADELLRLLGFEPDDVRTDGGSINLPKVRSLLAERQAEPAPAPADEPPPLPEPAWMTQLCGHDPHYFYTADQMRARDAYWIAKLQAERSQP